MKNIYTKSQEKRFLEWIRTLPSVLSGRIPCEACHIRVVGEGAGTGIKPLLCAVPMTNGEHRLQTHQGYYHTLFYFKREALDKSLPWKLAGITWFKERAMEYRKQFLEMERQGI